MFFIVVSVITKGPLLEDAQFGIEMISLFNKDPTDDT